MTRRPQSGQYPVSLDEVLSDSKSSLGDLLNRAEGLLQLERLLARVLGSDLATKFQVATVRKNRLILVSPSAVWATRIKMAAPQLLGALGDRGLDIQHIDVRVAPLSRPETPVRKERPLSDPAKKALDLMSDLVSEKDPS